MELNEEQIKFLNEQAKGIWTLNEKTGLVDIDGSFYCRRKGLKDLKGVRFGVVTGDFNCGANYLTSLVGAPQEVGGCFDCSNNYLTSLEGAPKFIGDTFDCSYNNLTSLEGAPKFIGKTFDFSDNNFPIAKWILLRVIDTMKDKGVNYYTALLLNKKSLDEEKDEILEKLEKIESVFTELDKHIPKDAQKGISMLGRFGHFD